MAPRSLSLPQVQSSASSECYKDQAVSEQLEATQEDEKQNDSRGQGYAVGGESDDDHTESYARQHPSMHPSSTPRALHMPTLTDSS